MRPPTCSLCSTSARLFQLGLRPEAKGFLTARGGVLAINVEVGGRSGVLVELYRIGSRDDEATTGVLKTFRSKDPMVAMVCGTS
jgi:hypothetical protein